MILFTLILFSGYLGFLSANECKDDVVFFCLPEDTFPIAFPENEAEINHICPIFIQFTQCILDHIGRCDSQESDESNHYKEDFENYYAVLIEICNEDSELHKSELRL
ncbi:hypothetical protein CDAR_563461 [Caerostris darwini]|uniref:Uncharacterized protein n=1 Tax=Caerostris darwini TaxID=1538125 RepID=A0AAV4WGD5_9ARAC|nr:hypothetical protein CDAR_563461 [Caerostris darwini]